MGFPNVGIALGAGVNELNRQRQLDDSEQRLQLQKDASAKVGRFQDAQLAEMDKRQQDHAAATAVWKNAMPVFQGGWQAAADHLGEAYNGNNADYGYNDGNKATVEKTDNGAYVTQTKPDGTVAARTFYSPQQIMNEHLRTVYSQLAAINPEYGKQLGDWVESQGREQTRQQDTKQKNDYTAKRDTVKDSQFDRELAVKTKHYDALEAQGAKSPRGLTPAQERANLEIDAARSAIAGLSPDEIKRKTANYTATGRENPDFDPTIAHAMKLSGRRKVGADDTFDAQFPDRQVSQEARGSVGGGADFGGATPGYSENTTGQSIDRADVAKRFRSDPSVNQHTLGKETPKGIEVLSKGKLIGYYR